MPVTFDKLITTQ